jgi:hypothetical protein
MPPSDIQQSRAVAWGVADGLSIRTLKKAGRYADLRSGANSCVCGARALVE